MKAYSAVYKGKGYTKTVPGWFKFLKDKPVFERYSENTMRRKLKQKKAGDKLSNAQCLGIREFAGNTSKSSMKKPYQEFSSKADTERYRLVNGFLRRYR